jgi:hypothetical protein
MDTQHGPVRLPSTWIASQGLPSSIKEASAVRCTGESKIICTELSAAPHWLEPENTFPSRSRPAGQVEPGSMNPSPVCIISRTFPELKHRDSAWAGMVTPLIVVYPVTVHWPGSMSDPLLRSAIVASSVSALLCDDAGKESFLPMSPDCRLSGITRPVALAGSPRVEEPSI